MTTDYGYVLPLEVDPPETICFQVHVPRDQFHIAAFMGQMWELTRWYNWSRDEAHTAIQVADVWKRIYEQVRASNCDCPLPISLAGLEDDMPFFRIVCENNKSFLEFQSCPDEWVRLANVDQLTNGTQPGLGQLPPPPGGGTQQTCAKLNANGTLLLPALVSSGDTITLDSVSGAGWDGGEFGFGPLWRLANGNQYVGGLDVGLPQLDSGDPIPTTNHMQLIAAIGATPIFVPLAIGSSTTVPSGITSQQVLVQVNDSAIGNNQGDYNLCVTVKNNQALNWCKGLDFTTSTCDFVPDSIAGGTPGASWGIGGWHTVDTVIGGGVEFYRQIDIALTIPSSEITSVSMTFNNTCGTFHDPSGTLNVEIVINGSSVARRNAAACVNGSGLIYSWTGDLTGVTSIILLQVVSSQTSPSYDGVGGITSCTICGVGPNPFA